MKFWSDVEKEYNELAGDSGGDGNDSNDSNDRNDSNDNSDQQSSTSEFNGLLSDIKNDLKGIPKAEVFPSFTSGDKDEENVEEEDSDDDQEEGRKRSLSSKSKKDKRCKVGGKTYEVGARWKDEKTGKDMICILMNIPQDFQPLLADEEILTPASNVEKDNSEVDTSSVEPQWSYTATPKNKKCPEIYGGKTSEKPDKIESNPDTEEKDSKEGELSASREQKTSELLDLAKPGQSNKVVEKLDQSDNQTGKQEDSSDTPVENPESHPEIETNKTGNEPEIIVVDPPESITDDRKVKADDNEGEDDDSESEEENEKSENDNKPKNSATTTKENEKVPEPKPIEGKTTNIPEKTEDGKEEDEEQSGDETESEIEQDDGNKPHKNTKDGTKEIKSEAIKLQIDENTPKQEIPSTHEGTESKLKESLQKTEERSDREENRAAIKQDNPQNNEGSLPESQSSPVSQESGQPIYTKETVVIQRKLIKTEETIETTETEKSKN